MYNSLRDVNFKNLENGVAISIYNTSNYQIYVTKLTHITVLNICVKTGHVCNYMMNFDIDSQKLYWKNTTPVNLHTPLNGGDTFENHIDLAEFLLLIEPIDLKYGGR